MEESKERNQMWKIIREDKIVGTYLDASQEK